MGPRPDSDTPGINLNDNPPSYEDVIDPVHQDQNHPQTQIFHSDYCVPGSRAYNSVSHDKRQTGVVTLAPGLTQNPSELHQLITEQACLPPRPYIRIEGRSTETRRQGQETKRQPVVDFDFKLDLTRSLLPAGDPGEWREFHVVRDGDGERAFRGGRWPSHSRTDAKPKGRMDLEQADEAVLDATAGTPTLMGWCERFCHDPAPVKSFTFTRKLNGFNIDPMRTVLSSHLRAANYRGDIKISTSIANGTITVCSPHWINRLRNHRFVFWACIILQLWIVTWPVIWFLERRYEVVRSVWRSSREVASPSGRRMVYACGKDEAAVADFWGPAVRQGAWCRTQESTILNQRDAELLLGAGRRNMQRQTLEEPLDRSLMMANSVAGGMFGRVRRTGGTQRFDLGMGNWSFSMALGGNH